MERSQIIELVNRERLIVIVRGVERELLLPLAQAMYDGGVRLLEVTYSANGSVADEETANRIAMLKSHFGDRMGIGAGTVLTPRQVALTSAAGGELIISPNVRRSVIEATIASGMVSMPGALTPTEIEAAYTFGADFVKLFPIADLGSGYVKAMRAPLSHIPMLAVGGINLENMEEYRSVGICGFGVGSNITDKKLLAAKDWDGIRRLAEAYVHAARG